MAQVGLVFIEDDAFKILVFILVQLLACLISKALSLSVYPQDGLLSVARHGRRRARTHLLRQDLVLQRLGQRLHAARLHPVQREPQHGQRQPPLARGVPRLQLGQLSDPARDVRLRLGRKSQPLQPAARDQAELLDGGQEAGDVVEGQGEPLGAAAAVERVLGVDARAEERQDVFELGAEAAVEVEELDLAPDQLGVVVFFH